MNSLYNEIEISAPIDKIWDALAVVDKLDSYDPTIKKSLATTINKSGIGAARKVEMLDGKNWFEESCTTYEKNKALTYTLTACSFPVHKLYHEYSFEQVGDKVRVTQKMNIQMKYGLLGKLMFAMLRPKWNSGIKEFLGGLKQITEKQ
ncbi:MAG: SRPBCC family protein [Cyclobacteriaceae bacterium]|nr:SRPBCC family protein [Cyclobacteriaceae bacterium]